MVYQATWLEAVDVRRAWRAGRTSPSRPWPGLVEGRWRRCRFDVGEGGVAVERLGEVEEQVAGVGLLAGAAVARVDGEHDRRAGDVDGLAEVGKVALLMSDIATGCALPLRGDGAAVLSKPSPTSSVAETLNGLPDTANVAAMAPLAMPKTMQPAAATAGTVIAANRRQRVPPCA